MRTGVIRLFITLQLHVIALQVKQSTPEVVELIDSGTANSIISSADFTNRKGQCLVTSFTYISISSYLLPEGVCNMCP